MKKLLWLIVCLMTMVVSVNAQKASRFNYLDYQSGERASNVKYSVPTEKSVETDNTLYLSGNYLKKSANCQAITLTCSIVGGGIAGYGAWVYHHGKMENNETIGVNCMMIGGVMGVAALISNIVGISYKWKSGKLLELSGNTLKYNF